MQSRYCLLFAAASTAVLTGCGGSVPTLAAGSSPQIVVATYLAATQSGDADTARSLMTDDHAEQYGTDGIGGTLSDVVINEPVSIGGNIEASAEDNFRGTSELSVRVDAELTNASSETLTDGSITWFVSLSRTAGDTWLVSGEGTGP